MSKILDFVEQPDVNTCQSAAIARILGTTDVYQIRKELSGISYKRGTAAGDPWAMAEFLEPRIQEYKFLDRGSINDAKAALDEGFEIITHGWFTQSGHVIGLSGWGHMANGEWVLGKPDDRGWVYFKAEDPWYEFEFARWRYSNRPGDDVPYSAYGIYAACIASWSYSGAIDIYGRGELDSSLGRGWLHLCKN
jgi:hypothetical protein